MLPEPMPRGSVDVMKNTFALILIAAVVAGCSQERTAGQSDAPAPSEKPTSGGRITVAVATEPDHLNPLVYRSSVASEVYALLHYGLVRLSPSDEWIAGIAESWQWAPDRKSVTLTIPAGLAWSDGQPFAAEDIVHSVELYKTTRAAAGIYLRHTDRVEAPDPNTVVWYFNKASSDELLAAVLNPLPRHLTTDLDPDNVGAWDYNRSPVGLGPFKLDSWRAGQSLSLVRNSHYHGEPAYLDEVVFKIVPDVANRILQLRNGEIDVVADVPPREVASLRENPDIEVANFVGRRLVILLYNTRQAPFDDARVRRAVSMALDRQLIADGPMFGFATPAASLFPPGIWAYDTALKPHARDLAAVGALLAEAGYEDTDGNGLVDRDGQDLKFTIQTRAGLEVFEAVAPLVQSQLAQAKIGVELRFLERSVEIGNMQKGEFDADLIGFRASALADPSASLTTDGPRNLGGYSNPDMDDVIARGLAARDRAAGLPIWQEFQRLFHEEQPVSVLYYPQTIVASRARVRSETHNQLNSWWDMHRWWVSDATP